MHALAVGRVVMRAAVGVEVANGDEFAPVIDERGGQDGPVLHIRALPVQFLVGDHERVARLDVEHEIDIPAEDVSKCERRLIMCAGVLHGLEQRAVDRGAHGAHARLQRIFQHVGAEPVALPRDFQSLGVVQAALETDQRAVPMHEVQGLARSQAVQVGAQPRQGAQERQVGQIELEATEDPIERVIRPDDDVDGGSAEDGALGGRVRDGGE